MSVHYLWDPGQNQEFPAATAATVKKAMLRLERQKEKSQQKRFRGT